MSDPGSTDNSANKRLLIATDRRGLSCTATILPGPTEGVPDAPAVFALLETYEIASAAIDRAAIDDLIARAQADSETEQAAVIARGTAPEHGLHARFTLEPTLADLLEEIATRRERADPAPGRDEAKSDGDEQEACPDHEAGVVDYRSQSAFVFVQAGESLGTVTEPTDGTDGVDVRGGVIAAKRGRSLRLTLDETTSITDGMLVARVEGVLRSSIDRVRVDTTLTISGDVDFSTGHIEFPGPVVVNGGVRDLFLIVAGGSVRVDQLVEAAEIRAGGNLLLNRGMAGRDAGVLRIAGDLRAGYLDSVTAEIGGCCVVFNEIKECVVTVRDRVESPACAFYGGRIDSTKRVDLGVVGSSGGVATEIAIGVLPGIEGMIERLTTACERIDCQRSDGAAELNALQNCGRHLTASLAERLNELQDAENRAGEMEVRIAAGARKLLGVLSGFGRPTLNVRRVLYRGVRVRLRHIEFVIKETVQGPVILDLDRKGLPRCFPHGSSAPVPISQIATLAGKARPDPASQLRMIADRDGAPEDLPDTEAGGLPEVFPDDTQTPPTGSDLGDAAA